MNGSKWLPYRYGLGRGRCTRVPAAAYCFLFVVDKAFLSALPRPVFLVSAGVLGELRGFLFVLGVAANFDGVDDEACFCCDLRPAASALDNDDEDEAVIVISGGLTVFA